jgi:hypothetical protein
MSRVEYMLFVDDHEYLMVELQMYKEMLMLLEKLKNMHSYFNKQTTEFFSFYFWIKTNEIYLPNIITTFASNMTCTNNNRMYLIII